VFADEAPSLSLKLVQEIEVVSREQELQELNTAAGHPEWRARVELSGKHQPGACGAHEHMPAVKRTVRGRVSGPDPVRPVPPRPVSRDNSFRSASSRAGGTTPLEAGFIAGGKEPRIPKSRVGEQTRWIMLSEE
jgi:hypothetical protein